MASRIIVVERRPVLGEVWVASFHAEHGEWMLSQFGSSRDDALTLLQGKLRRLGVMLPETIIQLEV